MKEYVFCDIEIISFEATAEDVLKVSEFTPGFGDDDFEGEWD